MRSLYLLVLLTIPLLAAAPERAYSSWLFGPSTYDECLDAYVKEAAVDFATKLVINACAKKFKTNEREEWAECVLDYVLNTRSELAVKAITSACTNRHGKEGNTPWTKCILEKMPGAETDLSAKVIASSCRG